MRRGWWYEVDVLERSSFSTRLIPTPSHSPFLYLSDQPWYARPAHKQVCNRELTAPRSRFFFPRFPRPSSPLLANHTHLPPPLARSLLRLSLLL